MHRVHDQSIAGRADGMADRDPAAVGIHDLVREAELRLRARDDGPERLVDLDDIEILRGDALSGARLLDGASRLGVTSS